MHSKERKKNQGAIRNIELDGGGEVDASLVVDIDVVEAKETTTDASMQCEIDQNL
jgi:hypothetical protein